MKIPTIQDYLARCNTDIAVTEKILDNETVSHDALPCSNCQNNIYCKLPESFSNQIIEISKILFIIKKVTSPAPNAME